MVLYFGKHSCKQFIRGKPIQFGYKCWMLASATGMPIQCKTEESNERGKQGKTKESNDDPLGTRVVNSALEVCKEPKKRVFFDTFFTSYKLVNELNTVGFSATGTMRENRSMKFPVMNVAEVKEKECGFYDYRSSGNISLVRWNDNSVVTLCSSAIGVHPIRNVKRRVRGKGHKSISPNQQWLASTILEWKALTCGSCFVTVPAKISRKKVVLGFASKCNQSWHVFCWRVYQLSNKNITQKDYIQTSAFTYHAHNFLCQMFQYTLRFFQNSSNLKTFTHYNLANT